MSDQTKSKEIEAECLLFARRLARLFEAGSAHQKVVQPKRESRDLERLIAEYKTAQELQTIECDRVQRENRLKYKRRKRSHLKPFSGPST